MKAWHVPENLMMQLAVDNGRVDGVVAASAEEHLVACATCQTDFAKLTSQVTLDCIWAEITDQIDRDELGANERLFRLLDAGTGTARLVVATPAVLLGAIAAVAAIVAAVVWSSRIADAGGAFLVLAPLVPTVLVALTFAPGADPAGECGLATPVFGIGLLLRRALTVEFSAIAVLALASLLVPIDGVRAIAWLLPALALSLGTLAAGARWSAVEAAAGLTVLWIVAVALANVTSPNQLLTESALFGAAGQLIFAIAIVGSCTIIALNRQTLFQEVRP